MAGGHTLYANDLQVGVSLLAVVTTPLILWAFSTLFPESPAEVIRPRQIIQLLLLVQIFPILLGMGIRALRASLADLLAKWVTLASTLFLVVLLVCILVVGSPSLLGLSIPSILAIALFVIACLAIGHTLGGPELDYKSTLAIGCLARNLGLALLIAKLNDAVAELLPVLISFMLMGLILGLPYSLFMKKRIAKQSELPVEPDDMVASQA